MLAWPVVAIGYLLAKDYKAKLSYWHSWKVLLLSVVIIGLSIYFSSFSHLNLGVISYFVPSVLGPLGLLLLASVVERLRIMHFFAYWGRNSLVLMVTHYSILMELFQIFDKYVMGCGEFVGWRTIVYFVITILLTYPLVWFFCNRASFMLGEK